MFSTLSLPFKLPSFLGGRNQARTIDIDPLPTHDIDHNPERRARTLKQLLKANHSNNQLFYNDLQSVNQTPDLLCTAYLLGATAEQLNELYEEQTHHLDRWPDRPGGIEDDVWRAHEIGHDDWREFLGKRNHQRNFADFYEDELVARGYDWKQLIEYYLYQGEDSLASHLISGSSPALMRLATAYQFNSRDLGIEALAMLSCLHRVESEEDSAKVSVAQTSRQSALSLTQILAQIAGVQSTEVANICDQWSALSQDPTPDAKQLATELKNMQIVGAILAATSPSFDEHQIQKEAVTTLNSSTPLLVSHALRILLPTTPARQIPSLLQQWLRLTVDVYKAMACPQIESGVAEINNLHEASAAGKVPAEEVPSRYTWRDITHSVLSQEVLTRHPEVVKAMSALKTAHQTWQDSGSVAASTDAGDNTAIIVDQDWWRKAGTEMLRALP